MLGILRLYMTLASTVFVLLLLLVTVDNVDSNSRAKRYLLFPRSAPTRIQLISGFGIPVDLNLESLTVGYVFKAEYFLPWNVSSWFNWMQDPFKPYPIPVEGGNGGSRRLKRSSGMPDGLDDGEKSESYAVEAQVIDTVLHEESVPVARRWYDEDDDEDAEGDNDNMLEDTVDDDEYTLSDISAQSPQNLGQSRFTLYKGLEKLAATSGLPGRPCMLRSICEAADVPFTYQHGILGELAHLIMTPSTSIDELSQHSDNEYLRAEQLGAAGEPCEHIFTECPTSFLHKFSGIYDTLQAFD